MANSYSFPAVPETLVLMSVDPIPTKGNFWSMRGNLPPLPSDPLPELNLYTDGTPGNYWYDDRDYDYSANSANASAATGPRRALGAYSTGWGSSSNGQTIPPGALWLQITGATNSIVSLNLNGATDTVYEVWSKTDLEQTNWNIETEVFPTNQQVMPFAVNQQGRGTLFLWARDWTGITSDGNETPEWWFFYYFGTTALSDTNLDVNGSNTLVYDYTNGINPTNITGLWMQIAGVTHGTISLALNNATDLVYEVWSATSLTNPVAWSIEQAVRPDTNQTSAPFTVEVQNRTNGLFFGARDWTGITSYGNLTTPEWWLWEYFGTVDLSETSLDGQGHFTLLDDYQGDRDPNVISFTPQFAVTTVSDPNLSGTLAIRGGIPSYMAVTIDNTNFATANWESWNSNITVYLGPSNGLYDVWIGLRGLAPHATQTWMETWITLYNAPLTLVVTNLSNNVSQSVFHVQGFDQMQLSSVAFDVSNATGFFANQAGSITGRFYDTNLLEFTTNYFQSGIVALAPGFNTITVRAVDFASNTVTTNFSVNYDLDTNPPVLTMIWPANNMAMSGSSLTIQAQVSDPTTTVMASANGNSVQGIVEQSGAVWLQNVPLVAGTNVVTVTATSAAGNMSATSLNVVQANMSLSIDPLPTNELNLPAVTVTGTVGDSSYNVWVNGVAAFVNDDDGTWEADDVPVNPSGTAIINAEAGTDLTNILAAQTLDQPQPVVVSLESIFLESEIYDYAHIACGWFAGNTFYMHCNIHLYWNDTTGGSEADSGYGLNGDLQKYAYSDFNPLSVAGGLGPWSMPWVYADFNYNEADDSCGFDTYTGPLSARTQVVILPSGQTQTGTTNLYLVSASAMEYSDPYSELPAAGVPFEGGDVPLPAAWLKIQGQPLTNNVTTNDDGSIWGTTLVSALAGTPVVVTPLATQIYSNNIHSFNVLATNVSFQLTIVSNSATQIDATDCAVVKTNGYVTLQAHLSDTNLIPLLTWSGGQAVPGNPVQRQVSAATSLETNVTASLGSYTLRMDVWVIWGTVQILTIGQNPSNAPPLALLPPAYTNEFGPLLVLNGAGAVGLECAVATITPTDLHTVITNGWNFRQEVWDHDFKDGAPSPGFFDTNWVDDSGNQFWKTLIPDAQDVIYYVDGPIMASFGATNCAERYMKLHDWIEWNGTVASDGTKGTDSFPTAAEWQSTASPQIITMNLGGGYIVVPNNPAGCP